MIDHSQVSIIIPHLGEDERAEYALNQCLVSLKETVPDIKVIVSVNGINCGLNVTHKIFDHSSQSIVVVTEQGQCKATNAAVAITNTPWILVTNDDMVYAPGWFEKLVLKEYAYPTPKCISPKLIEPRDGAPTFEKQMFGGVGGDFNKQAWLDFAKNYKGEGLRTGFNLPFLISRELWDIVGGYDINYDPWGSNSDSDLEYKIKLAGVQPYQNTNSIVYHFSNTSGTFEPRNQGFWNKNFAYFQEKWGFPRTDDGIWEASFDIPGPPTRKYQPAWEGKYK